MVMARKPPYDYIYEVGTYVSISTYSHNDCGKDFIPDTLETAKRFASKKGFGNTGKFMVDNREKLSRLRDQSGWIIDRVDGLYLVMYNTSITSEINLQSNMVLCAEIEVKPLVIEPFDDAVMRWLSAGKE
jgi:hypothetical protein